MNDLFGVNYETNAYECEKITIKKADDHIVKKIQKCMEDKTEFKDESGKEIELNHGQTWIEIVSPDTSVTIK